ncbi:MAG: DUF1588 domain-containing protein [Polyangiales bacterium]
MALLTLSGCMGLVDGPIPVRSGSGGSRITSGITDVGTSSIVHLTRMQYANAVEAVVGARFDAIVEQLPADEATVGYEIGSNISPTLGEAYLTAAESIGGAIEQAPEGVFLCDLTAPESSCVDAFIADIGRRAFRRSLEEGEFTSLRATFDATRGTEGVQAAVGIVVQMILASPSFLYVYDSLPDGAGSGDVVRRSGTEIITRLSLSLWNTLPDVDLIARAESGEFDEDAPVDGLIDEMLDDARAEGGFRRFYEQWLGITSLLHESRDGDYAVYPRPYELGQDLVSSLDAYVDDIMWSSGGGVRELFLSDFVYVNDNLAVTLALPPVEGTELARMDSVPNRLGLLTQPAFLVAHAVQTRSDPVRRGKAIRERFLCGTLPPPTVAVNLGTRDMTGLTTRQILQQEHLTEDACAGCHRLMDPLGFGLENFDQLGAFRADEQDIPIDATGNILDGGDAEGDFDGYKELAGKLADSANVEFCVARHYFRYEAGRLQTAQEEEAILNALESSTAQGSSLRAMVRELSRVNSMRYHRVE